ncbi:MAG TPA: M20 family metallopeptidase [Thermomicrobiaceae bacterium]|nr:M20 family metallopeptidase [Thermomicrobiaceae bacterium]
MAADAQTVLAHARAAVDRYLLELAEIVDVDSGTRDKAGVDRAGSFLARLLAGIGCELRSFPNTELGDNFTATLRGDGERRVALLGHFDTVFPRGTVAERHFTISERRAYGPGVLDMKGGLILGYHAMRILGEIARGAFAELVFVANGDEEVGSPSSRGLIEAEARRADAVLVLEPGREPGSVLATRKGVGMYEVEIFGRAAHAGAAPEEGASAVLELAHKIIALHALNDPTSGTTVSANLARGGTARNVIPADARASVDLRVTTPEEAARVDAAIHEIGRQARVPGTRTDISGGLNRPPMVPRAGTQPLLERARELDRQLGLEFAALGSGGGSDGNFTAALGVPTLDGLGPVGRNAHSVDEYIELDSIPARLALLTGLILGVPLRPGRA